MDSELFDAEQVLTGSNAGGNCDRVVVCLSLATITLQAIMKFTRTLQVPGRLPTGEGRSNLLNLYPVGRAISCSCAGNLGQVERNRSLVVYSLICGEGDRGTGGD